MLQTNNETNHAPITSLLRKTITEEGAFRLAAAILESAYKDYVRSLKQVMFWWKKKCEDHKYETEWKRAIRTKNHEESFYYSQRFEILTLGKSMPGKDVINKIQKMNGYYSTVYER